MLPAIIQQLHNSKNILKHMRGLKSLYEPMIPLSKDDYNPTTLTPAADLSFPQEGLSKGETSLWLNIGGVQVEFLIWVSGPGFGFRVSDFGWV